MYDNHDYKKDIQFRIRLILILIFCLTGVLVYNLYFLQIQNSQKYLLLSDKNRIRLSPVLPRRGRILTSDGKIIAQNYQRYKLSMETCNEEIFLKNINLLSTCIELNIDEKKNILELRRSAPRYTPIILRDGLSWDEYSKIALIFFKLNHVTIDNIFVRNYSMPMEFSHITGYTARSNDNFQILLGKSGIECSLNEDLMGKIGNIQTEINSVGKKMRVIDSVEPVNGNDVVLTINSEIQKYAYDIIAAEKAGACVILDITDGGVIALVSAPGFDTNMISSKLTQKQWNDIITDELTPLLNRAVAGLYPPGSIFKIITAFAALSEGVISSADTVYCSGSVVMDNHTFHCWNRYGHGKMNVYDALKVSCDCYFFEIAKKLGIDNIVKYARKFGFGAKTGIELPNESAGLLPNKEWKFLRYGNFWKPYETLITGIGQGALLSTLLQTAAMFGKIYTNNYDFSPTIIKKTDFYRKKISVNPITGKNIDVIKHALYQVCNSGGSAMGSCKTEYGISGKTGSSQVRRIKENEAGIDKNLLPWHHRDHAFFVGCAPYKNPKYVVAVMIEHGGWGSVTAAPIARKIFDKLMEMESVNTAHAEHSKFVKEI